MKKLLLILSLVFSINAFSQVPSYVPSAGLVAWWPFNGNANDESGNGNNGTVNGATLTPDRLGNANSAYYFSSAGCATRIDATVNTSSIVSGLTISVWVLRVGNGCLGPRILEFYVPGDGPGESQWGWDNAGSTGLGAKTSTGFYCASSFTAPPDNTWTFLVYTNDGINGRFYQDGVLYNTIPSTGDPILSGNAAFGRMNHPAYDAFNGNLDDIGIWNRALDSCEVKDLYFYSLGNCCNVSVTTQPINQSVNISNNAQFTTASSDPLATYQWQTDLGVGYLNLNSVGQYSGATNDTLSIANTTLSNNNQPFRCIVSSGSCTDTSAVAVLTVVNNVGINEVYQSNLFTVYPNPTNSTLTINTKAIYSSIQIVNTLGQLVFTKEKSTSLNVSSLPSGIYFIQLVDTKGSVIGKEKFVKE